MSRFYNFGPGPAKLPESVLNKARKDLPKWHSRSIKANYCKLMTS
jgi:phosphoserine aminotransferase